MSAHVCTKADPWVAAKGSSSIHPEAREMRVGIFTWLLGFLLPSVSRPLAGKKRGTTTVWCPHCGQSWDGDASEVARAVSAFQARQKK